MSFTLVYKENIPKPRNPSEGSIARISGRWIWFKDGNWEDMPNDVELGATQGRKASEVKPDDSPFFRQI